MSTLKPITLYSMASGTNPWKINFIFEELSLPFKTVWVAYNEVKAQPFVSVNPNGRIPAIEDPNTGITLTLFGVETSLETKLILHTPKTYLKNNGYLHLLPILLEKAKADYENFKWESGAIIEYLIETYDKDYKLSYASGPEIWYCKQWLAFQISGQGPYWGQAVWFTNYHSEKIPSARQRYVAEVQRVIMVLDKWLKDNGTLYLVGDKCTYADLAFITWCDKVQDIDTEGVFDVQERYGAYHEWLLRLKERPAVKKALEDKAQNLAQGKQ